MRFIPKGAEPGRLRAFKRENGKTPELLRYPNLPRPVREELHARMLAEQGWLCAYTMLPICRRDRVGDEKDYHIEHIEPQAHVDRALDYRNMVLCTSRSTEFGAFRKVDKVVDASNFVSPLSLGCEERLNYRRGGEVRTARAGDEAATNTVDLLNLNHPALVAARAEALRALGLHLDSARPISAGKALRLVRGVMAANHAGHIAPFCVAIRQVAERFARRRQGRAARIARATKR